MVKYHITDADGFSQVAEVTSADVKLTNPSGYVTELLSSGDDFIYKTTDLQGNVKKIKVPNEVAYDLPLLMILLNKVGDNLFPVTTVTEMATQFKIFEKE